METWVRYILAMALTDIFQTNHCLHLRPTNADFSLPEPQDFYCFRTRRRDGILGLIAKVLAEYSLPSVEPFLLLGREKLSRHAERAREHIA